MKISCPTCHKNDAIIQPIYGPTACQECLDASDTVVGRAAINAPLILGGKKESRIRHWQEIKNRVFTHEGEFLTGEAGKAYQKKWSERYLGKNLAQSVNFNSPQYQRELEKTQ